MKNWISEDDAHLAMVYAKKQADMFSKYTGHAPDHPKVDFEFLKALSFSLGKLSPPKSEQN